jgi:hypothetical protein
MHQRALIALFVLAETALAPAQALACSFPIRHHSNQEIVQIAQEALTSSTTVIDGEVVTPMFDGENLPDGTLPVAYIKVSRTWKGSVDGGYATVAYFSSCDVHLGLPGQKLRILLNGTGIFTASQSANGVEAVYERDAFNRAIDRLLGATRPADFTDPGSPPPPEKH